MTRRVTIGLIFILVVLGCETEPIIFTGPYFVRFTESALVQKESSSSLIQVSVHVARPTNEEDLLINYEISGSARENVDYVIESPRGVVTIEEDEYFGFINIRLINNANNIIRSQDLVLNLMSTSQSELHIGQGDGGIGKKYTLTIQDDCILGGDYIQDEFGFDQPVALSSSDCEKYKTLGLIAALYVPTGGRSLNYFNLQFEDNGDNTLTIPEQKQSSIDEVFKIYETFSGNGSVDPVTNEITLTVVPVDSVELKFTVSIKRN